MLNIYKINAEVFFGYLCFVIIIFSLESCIGKNEDDPKFYLESKTVADGIVKDWNKNYFFKSDGELRVATVEGAGMQFYNIKSNTPIAAQSLPNGISGRDRFVVKNETIWAGINDSLIVVKADGRGYTAAISKLIPKEIEIQDYSFFDIWSKKNLVLFPIINYDQKYELEEGLVSGYDYVGYWNYETNQFGTFKLKYNPIYENKNIDRPKLYLTVSDSTVIISEHYSPYISVIDYDEKIHNIELSSKNYKINDLPRIEGTSRETILESVYKIQQYSEGFGQAFEIESNPSKGFVRFYYHRLDEQSKNGKFNSIRDKRIEILFTSDNQERKYEIPVPSGRFFQKDKWFIDNDTLYYPKWLQKSEAGHSYIVDCVYLGL